MYNYFISVKDIVYKCYDLTLCIFVLKENFTSNPGVKRLVMHSNMLTRTYVTAFYHKVRK